MQELTAILSGCCHQLKMPLVSIHVQTTTDHNDISALLPFFTRETTFVSACLLYCTPNPFWKGVCSKRKEFAPKGSKFFSFRVGTLSEGRQKQFDRVTSPECVSVILNLYTCKYVQTNVFKCLNKFIIGYKLNEPGHDKTYKTCATSKGSDQPLQLQSLIRVLAERMCLLQPPGYPKRDK